jgi:alkanesulfonate monooxygenase SsuD/methylene tetrahydromethanopterin reductase-like flavin-dependent oxidoreductase (luciferase family)
MTPDLRGLMENPALQQMLKYSFVGNRETVRKKTEAFLAQTGVNEIMVVSNIYDHEDRIKSYRIFAEIMKGI